MDTRKNNPDTEIVFVQTDERLRLLERSWASCNSVFVGHQQIAPNDTLIRLLRKMPQELREGHFVLATSGSTGDVKLVVGEKARCTRMATEIHSAQICGPVHETLCTLPLSYSYALVNQWVWAQTMGKVFRKTLGFSNPADFSQAIFNSENAMICIVASQLPVFHKCFAEISFPSVIRLNFAGERFPQEELPFIRKLFPNAEIFNNYGCTEAMPRLTIRHADDSDDASNIGRPLPGIELRADEEGRLLFRSPYGAVATISEDGLKRIGPDDWVETGDFGEQCADGTWRVLGRTNSVFKRFGEKVSVSRVVDELRGAWDGEIVGYTGEDPAGAPGWSLVLAPEPAGEEVRKILLALREAYTRPHWPIRIESMASLPRLPNGKIDLQALKDAENKKLHWRQRI